MQPGSAPHRCGSLPTPHSRIPAETPWKTLDGVHGLRETGPGIRDLSAHDVAAKLLAHRMVERFIGVDERLSTLDKRMGQLEVRVGPFEERFKHLEGGLTNLQGGLTNLQVGLTALRSELKQELATIQNRLAALEASSTQLNARVDLLANDTRQRFRMLIERVAAIETRLAA